MCITKIRCSKRKIAVGYKSAIKQNGRYYSPFTGLEYKVGKVPMLEEMKVDKIHSLQIYSEYGENGVFHSPNYNGYTAIYKTLNIAITHNIAEPAQVFIKLTLTGIIKTAKHTSQSLLVSNRYRQYTPVYIGNFISKIEEIQIN